VRLRLFLALSRHEGMYMRLVCIFVLLLPFRIHLSCSFVLPVFVFFVYFPGSRLLMRIPYLPLLSGAAAPASSQSHGSSFSSHPVLINVHHRGSHLRGWHSSRTPSARSTTLAHFGWIRGCAVDTVQVFSFVFPHALQPPRTHPAPRLYISRVCYAATSITTSNALETGWRVK
jgi:hypothetical protein